MSLFCRWIREFFMPNDNIDDHPHAIEVGQVVGVVQEDQQAGIHPLNIGDDLGGGQGRAATIGLDGDGDGGDTDQHAVELQAAEEGGIQDDNGGGDAGGSSSGGDTGQHVVGLQAAEEGNVQDENGGGDGGNAGQGVADPQHGGDAAIDGDGIGNDDDARLRLRLSLSLRLRKLLLFWVRSVLRLVALYCVKTVFFEDSLSLFDVLRLCAGVVLMAISVAIECLLVRGVVNDTEADLLFTRSRSVVSFVLCLLVLLAMLC